MVCYCYQNIQNWYYIWIIVSNTAILAAENNKEQYIKWNLSSHLMKYNNDISYRLLLMSSISICSLWQFSWSFSYKWHEMMKYVLIEWISDMLFNNPTVSCKEHIRYGVLEFLTPQLLLNGFIMVRKKEMRQTEHNDEPRWWYDDGAQVRWRDDCVTAWFTFESELKCWCVTRLPWLWRSVAA